MSQQQQQQLEKRSSARPPLTLPQPSDLASAIGRDWKNPKKLQESFDAWVKQQHPVLEVVTATIAGSGQGAFLGGVMGVLTKASGDPALAGQSGEMAKQMAQLQAGGPLVQARNFAVMTGVNAGIATACRKARGGVEDVYGTMIAAFGSGAAFSLVSGMGSNATAAAATAAAGAAAGTAAAAAGTANPLQAAFTTGCFFALFQGAFYKIGGAFGGGGNKAGKGNPAFDGPEAYARTNYMLQTLQLSQYEKNIRRAQLSDATLLLWTEQSLQEAKIPPGPRLVLLNHLDHYRKNMMKPGSLAPGQLPPPPPPPLK